MVHLSGEVVLIQEMAQKFFLGFCSFVFGHVFEFLEEIFLVRNDDLGDFLCNDIFELIINKHDLIYFFGGVGVDLMADRGSDCKVNWRLDGCCSLSDKIGELPVQCIN